VIHVITGLQGWWQLHSIPEHRAAVSCRSGPVDVGRL